MAGLGQSFSNIDDIASQVTGGYGKRIDGTNKGRGWLGPLRASNGNTMTEVSSDITLQNGDNLHFPLVTPNQSFQDLSNLLTGGNPSDGMYDAAIDHALSRKLTGRDPFAGIGEQTTLGAAFGGK